MGQKGLGIASGTHRVIIAQHNIARDYLLRLKEGRLKIPTRSDSDPNRFYYSVSGDTVSVNANVDVPIGPIPAQIPKGAIITRVEFFAPQTGTRAESANIGWAASNLASELPGTVLAPDGTSNVDEAASFNGLIPIGAGNWAGDFSQQSPGQGPSSATVPLIGKRFKQNVDITFRVSAASTARTGSISSPDTGTGIFYAYIYYILD